MEDLYIHCWRRIKKKWESEPMSLWKFGDFEADVDFTDADFLDAIDEAKAAMHEGSRMFR